MKKIAACEFCADHFLADRPVQDSEAKVPRFPGPNPTVTMSLATGAAGSFTRMALTQVETVAWTVCQSTPAFC